MSAEKSRPGQGAANSSSFATASDSTAERLERQHREELLTHSAISPEMVLERDYRTVGRPNSSLLDAYGRDTRERLRAMGFPSWSIREDHYFPGLHIPMYSPSGQRLAGQWKPFRPVRNRDGKQMKYASPSGQTSRLDVHPHWSIGAHDAIVPPIRDANVPLWITEGIKKADSLTSRGVCTVALQGVYNWRGQHGTLGDWEDVPLKSREVTVCFDADARTNPTVLRAMRRLGKWLRSKGVAKVWYLVTPAEFNGAATKGADDYFAAGGDLAGLQAARASTCPHDQASEDLFTDARMADTVADEVLADQFIWTAGLGWLGWEGRRWDTVAEAEVTEAVRQYVLTQYIEALDTEKERAASGQSGNAYEVDGWRKLQSAARIKSVLSLATGVAGVLRDAADFDTDPDLLNTPSGVVDLRTGEVQPHSPELLMTRITAAAYRPGAESAYFKAALEAVPEDALEWLQLRIGQACTGYTTDDGRILLLTGVGRNGKTLLMGSVFRALGGGERGTGYATLVPNTLLLKGKALGAATPEKMTLRGTRLAYMEETPEEGYLDSQVVKELMDAEAVEGRRLYRDPVMWRPTHSIFLNTNHAPTVTDTGDGAWRRLARIDFPYRFRLNGDPIERETDRAGDPALSRRLREAEAQEAILSWIVAGAQRWYANGSTLSAAAGDPASVRESVRAWREASDDVLRFLNERMTFDPDRWVTTTDLYREFAEWLRVNGQRVMSAKEFLKRITSHNALPSYVQAGVQVRASRPGISVAEDPFGTPGKPLPEKPRAVVGLAFTSA